MAVTSVTYRHIGVTVTGVSRVTSRHVPFRGDVTDVTVDLTPPTPRRDTEKRKEGLRHIRDILLDVVAGIEQPQQAAE
jgi:hypothetical protein